MLEVIRQMIDRWREEKAVAALGARDLAELGMTRDQVLTLIRMPTDTPQRVVAMGRVFGLSEGALKKDRSQWLNMVECCAECRDRGACALLLQKGTLANPRDAAFCPNHPSFEAHWGKA